MNTLSVTSLKVQVMRENNGKKGGGPMRCKVMKTGAVGLCATRSEEKSALERIAGGVRVQAYSAGEGEAPSYMIIAPAILPDKEEHSHDNT